MDAAVPDIKFDADGICDYCTDYMELMSRPSQGKAIKRIMLDKIVQKMKRAGKRKKYDCLIGISGGLDSSYILYYMVKKLGLRPLAVHVDNHWNTDFSVKNIKKLCDSLNVDLYNYVAEWQEFKSMQKAFFKANVIDVEMVTDYAVFALLYKIAAQKRIKYVVLGTNIASEGMKMPPGWCHFKWDSANIKAISRTFSGIKKLRHFPFLSFFEYMKYMIFGRIKDVSLLNYMSYEKKTATETLVKEIGWKPYEKKHYESVFTRFYQGHILPVKFGVDKRKLHYSTLICSGQMSRAEALELMGKPTYEDLSLLEEDRKHVLGKLGFSDEEFEHYLKAPAVPHDHYPSNKNSLKMLLEMKKFVRKVLKPA
jgi:N-acetyl sugar amidotransferase